MTLRTTSATSGSESMRVGFGPWRPDLPPLAVGVGDVLRAEGCVPEMLGYGAQRSLVDAGFGGTDARCRGALAGLNDSGYPRNFAGDANKLYLATVTGMTDVSGPVPHILGADDKWRFAQFGETMYAVTPSERLLYYDMRISTEFQPVELSPQGRHVAVVAGFLVVGNYFDEYEGAVPHGVRWCAIGNPRSWPVPGTDIALSAQSDFQPLEGNGGWVRAIVEGNEVGAVFQERAIYRMDFRGGDVIFEFTRVESTRGCLIPDLAIPFGRDVLYLAEDGWYVLRDYTVSQEVGDEVLNRTFFDDLDLRHPDRISWSVSPDQPLIFIAYPGRGNINGTPNRILVYNYSQESFSIIDETLEQLVVVLTPARSMDDIPGIPMDDPSFQMDDRLSAPGAPIIGGYNDSHQLSSFTGEPYAAVIETGNLEPVRGERSYIGEVRPLIEGAFANVQIAPLDKSADLPEYGVVAPQNDIGSCMVRSEGRYHRIKAIIPPGGFWSCLGVEFDRINAGNR